MCFYDEIRMTCNCSKWGSLRQHCSKEYRTGETCGMKLVMERYQSTEKCKTCTKIDTELRAITRSEKAIRRWRLQLQRGEYFSSVERLREDPQVLEHRIKEVDRHIQEKKLELVVLRAMLPEMREKNMYASALQPLARQTVSSLYSSCELPPAPRLSMSITPKEDHYSSKLASLHDFKENEIQSHPALDLASQDIRLFELTSATGESNIKGKFHIVSLSASIPYTALSYTWGDPGKNKFIEVDGKQLAVPENLWWFLHAHESSTVKQPNYFWIDAICIDQTNIRERNHQVGLMKLIYSIAGEVLLWLGREANNSDLAIDFIMKRGATPLKPKGSGYRKMWTRDEGQAIVALCERGYWRRIWIIQEIIHARRIKVLCGKRTFEWHCFEALYAKLKALELRQWITHHEHAGEILHSFASVMVWQRAHWRHPDTPTPRLRTLLEVFEDWQCTDIQDKIFGLLGMVQDDKAICVDYSKSLEEIYDEVRTIEFGPITPELCVRKDYLRFCSLLRRVLKLAEYW